MKRIAVLTLLFVAVIAPAAMRAAPAEDQKTTTPPTIPKDAVANGNGTWSWSDKEGKHWTYSNGPFGVTRVPAVSTTPSVKAPPAGLPKGAISNADGSYSWTDQDGKKWIYKNTPFGISRTSANPSSDWKVTDKGDTVRFEHPGGPMGVTIWEKKKTELTDEERHAWQSQKAASQTARPE